MISASDIRDVLVRYLSQEDAEKFVRDFSALSYNIHKNGDAEAIGLANEIESKMADLHSGLISLSDFSDFIRALVNPFVMNVSVPVVMMTSGSINFAAEVGTAFPAWAGFFGTSRAEESELEGRSVRG